MPALFCCKKKWAIGSDDFVIPSLVALVLRIIWFISSLYLLAFSLFVECLEGLMRIISLYLLCQLPLHFVVALSETLIFSESAKGPVLPRRIQNKQELNEKLRHRLPIFLFIRCFLFLLELVNWTVGITLMSSIPVFLQSSTAAECLEHFMDTLLDQYETYALGYGLNLLIIAVIFLAFLDPLGCCGTSSFYKERKKRKERALKQARDSLYMEDNGESGLAYEAIENAHPNDSDHDKIAEMSSWYQIIDKLLCCMRENKNTSVQSQIASALAVLFENEIDLVLTDVLAAFKLVQEQQKVKLKDVYKCDKTLCTENSLTVMMRNYTHNTMNKQQFVGGKEDYIYQEPQDVRLEDIWIFKEALHFFDYAHAVYGWKHFVACHKQCTGICHILCATRCCCYAAQEDDPIEGDPHLLETAGFVLAANIDREHILYSSWTEKIYESPFTVAYDPEMNCIVLAIRGTMSLQDIMTNFSVKMVSLSNEDTAGLPQQYKGLYNMVHQGMYLAANDINTKLLYDNKFQIDILESVFEEFPEAVDVSTGAKKLVIMGHSLGGGIASILALVLKPQYPHLKCFAFSPPGCVMSYPLATYSKDFTFSFAVANEIVPRLNWRSILFLKKSLETRLRESSQPKHSILCPVRNCFSRNSKGVDHLKLDENKSIAPKDVRNSTAKPNKKKRSRSRLSLVLLKSNKIHVASNIELEDGNKVIKDINTPDETILKEVFTAEKTNREHFSSVLVSSKLRLDPIGSEDPHPKPDPIGSEDTQHEPDPIGSEDPHPKPDPIEIVPDPLVVDVTLSEQRKLNQIEKGEDNEVNHVHPSISIRIENVDSESHNTECIQFPTTDLTASSLEVSETTVPSIVKPAKPDQRKSTKLKQLSFMQRLSRWSLTGVKRKKSAFGLQKTRGSTMKLQKAALVSHIGSIWRGKTTVTKAVRQMNQVSQVPAFIPGRVFLMEEKCQQRKNRMNCLSTSKNVVVREVANEDFCFIDLGSGSFYNHLPTSMMKMLTKVSVQLEQTPID